MKKVDNVKTDNDIKDAALTVEEEKKDIDIPVETVEKMLKNEFQMNSVGTDEVEIPIVEPKKDENEVEKVDEKVDLSNSKVKYNDIIFPARGFNSLDEAIKFMEKPYFKGLCEADKREFRNWLIKK